jgi:hypothetical protein
VEEEFERDGRTTGIRFDVLAIEQPVRLRQPFDIPRKLAFTARIPERRVVQ